jgi:RNA polymerase sigma factor (sigma-70 family)
MEIARNNEQSKISYTDEDLFVLMSYKEENEDEAKEAFTIFYDRYLKLVWSLCYKVCSYHDRSGNELAEDVFNNVMISIYEHPTYDSSKGKLSTWISKIARNEMKDLLDLLNEKRIGEKKFVALNDKILSNIHEEVYSEADFETPEKKILDDAIKTLSDREQEILLKYMLYQDGNKHLPDDVLKALCDKYGTTSVNLRKIKERSLKKIRIFIEQNSDLMNE